MRVALRPAGCRHGGTSVECDEIGDLVVPLCLPAPRLGTKHKRKMRSVVFANVSDGGEQFLHRRPSCKTEIEEIGMARMGTSRTLPQARKEHEEHSGPGRAGLCGRAELR